MDSEPPTISPELIALVDEGDGFAEVYDPATNRVFVITEEKRPHPLEHPATVEETRALLDEARRSLREEGPSTMSTDDILREARRRAGSS